MNLKELSQLDIKDLKNLDYTLIAAKLKKRPDIIAAIVSIVVTCIFCLYFYQTKKAQFVVQNQELAQLKEKASIHTQTQDAQAVLKTLKSALPEPITEAQFIEIITQAASKLNVVIVSFSPASKENYSVYSAISLSITITAPSYTRLWEFINTLESENKTIKINSWSIQTGERQQRFSSRIERPVSDQETINSTITLMAFNFNND